jgi:hypothetical protein
VHDGENRSLGPMRFRDALRKADEASGAGEGGRSTG